MEGSSNGDKSQEGTSKIESVAQTVEIKIKTLDSQVYTCHVEKQISVPALKEHIATLTGVPVESQRLICRGKVLKDDHILSAYNVEDGHTLHLVTRQAPQPGGPSSSSDGTRNAGVGEEQDSLPNASRNRPGQVSHSVVLGTFNIPDSGDGAMPDVGRIITSVLSSLGISNLVPTNNAANNGGFVGGSLIPGPVQPPTTDTQDTGAGGGGGRVQVGAQTGQQSLPSDQRDSPDTEPHNDTVHNLRPAAGFFGTIPVMGQQFRLMQQVIPDALTTMSHYLNRLEQVFATNGQPQGQTPLPAAFPLNSVIQPSSSISSQPVSSQTAPRSYPTPGNLGVIIRRTMELLNSQAGAELSRLASQLENEPNLTDVAARGELQSSALRDGVLMQHLGALLLELGRATLTLRMGSSPGESAVNAGPAVFISPAGPNPMMVQPLPFQPGAGIGTLMGGIQQNIGAVGPSLGPNEAPRNINIHIHASDSGLGSGAPSQVSIQNQGGVSSNSIPVQVSNPVASMASGEDRTSIPIQASTTASGSNAPVMQSIPMSLQGTVGQSSSEQAGLRVVPMRTVVAAMPSTLHNRPPSDAAGASLGVFYPLLARFQQLNSAQFPQQVGGLQSTSINGVPSGSTVQPGTSMTQSPVNHVSPTVRAQVQVQAWVPSVGQAAEGQGGSRSLSNEGNLQIPFTSIPETSSLNGQHQQLQIVGTVNNTAPDAGAGLPADGRQAVVPNDSVLQVGVSSGIQQEEHGGQGQACNQSELAKLSGVGERVQTSTLHGGENDAMAATSSGSTHDTLGLKDNEVVDAPVGLGLRGLQPLPSRTQKKSYKQQHRQQAVDGVSQYGQDQSTASGHQGEDSLALSNRGQNSMQGFSSSLAPSSEETGAVGTGSSHAPAGMSQLLNSVMNRGRPAGGIGSNGDIGNLISQLMAGGNSSVTATARDSEQGVTLPAGALGNLMGQVMQSPFMANVLQQVVEQVGEEPQDFREMLSHSSSNQGGLNFSAILQQMMPVVSQALGRVSATGSDQASSLPQSTGIRSRDYDGVRSNMNSTEQVREGANGFDVALSEGLDAQGGSNLAAMLQQMMPVVAQTLGRAMGAAPEQASSFHHDLQIRSREEVGAEGGAGPLMRSRENGTEPVREDGNTLSEGLDGQGGPSLAAILQQMMPVVAQVARRGSLEQASDIHRDLQIRPKEEVGTKEDAGPANGDGPRIQPTMQDESPQCSETIATVSEQQQSTTESQRPASEVYSGGAPVAKRQKIDLERAVQKLEQDKSVEDVLRLIAESASTLMALTDSPGADASHLAEYLSQDDDLVNDYTSLLLRDLTKRSSGDP